MIFPRNSESQSFSLSLSLLLCKRKHGCLSCQLNKFLGGERSQSQANNGPATDRVMEKNWITGDIIDNINGPKHKPCLNLAVLLDFLVIEINKFSLSFRPI